jgi:hypothetical protein
MQLGRLPHKADQLANLRLARRGEAAPMQPVMQPDDGLIRGTGIDIGAEDVADPNAEDEIIIPLVPGENRSREALRNPQPARAAVEQTPIRVHGGEMSHVVGLQFSARSGEADPFDLAGPLDPQDVGGADRAEIFRSTASSTSDHASGASAASQIPPVMLRSREEYGIGARFAPGPAASSILRLEEAGSS